MNKRSATPKKSRRATAKPGRKVNVMNPPQTLLEYLRSHQKIAVLALVLFLFSTALAFFLFRSTGQREQAKENPVVISEPVEETPTVLTVLLMGYGGANHDGGLLTDTMMLARIDSVNKYIALISVPRDLWVPLPLLNDSAPTWIKINSAYAIGSGTLGFTNRQEQFQGPNGGGMLAKTIIGTITGLKPDYYAAVNFDAFTDAIDTIGPLTVEVPYTFTDSLYPIRGEERNLCNFTEADLATLSAQFKNSELEQQFACRYEVLQFERGKTVMDGETALKFVRSRHGDVGGSDFGRAQRQQALVDAVKQKVFSLSFLPRIIPLAQQLLGDVHTDISVGDLPVLLGRFSDLTSYKVYSISLTDDNVLVNGQSTDRQYILAPRVGHGNWSEIQYYINRELKNASESAVIASQPATESGTESAPPSN